MVHGITIEVIGFRNSSCGPFPCDENRRCGLDTCHPTNSLVKAFESLSSSLDNLYGGRVSLNLTLLDEGVPDYVEEIIERQHPPLPIILINGRVTPIGRISLPLIKKEIESCIKSEI